MNQKWLVVLLISSSGWAGGEVSSQYKYNSNKAYFENYAYPKLVMLRMTHMAEFSAYRSARALTTQDFEIYSGVSNYLYGAVRGIHALSAEGFLLYEIISGENYLTGERLEEQNRKEKYEAYRMLYEYYSDEIFKLAFDDLISHWELKCHVTISK